MSFLLNEQFAPPGDGDDEILRLLKQLESGVPMDQQIAAQRLIEMRAEKALVTALRSKNPIAAQLATSGLWECWLNEQGPEARKVMDAGIARMEQGELEDALEIFVRLCRQHPDWAEAHNKRATALYLLGNARQSYKACQLVVELKPDHFGAWNGMALCAAQMEKWRAALNAAQRGLALQPGAQANLDLIALAEERLREGA